MLPPIPRFLLPRTLPKPTTTFLRHASKGASPKKPKPSSPPKTRKPSPSPSKPPRPIKYFSLPESLGSSGRPSILLYEHRPHLFLTSCYGLATLMVGWSAYTLYTNVYDARPGAPRWVMGVSLGSVTVMTVMALAVGYYPSRIIQAIYAHPIPATASRPAGISLALHCRPILPMFPVRKLHVASPEVVGLAEAIHLPRVEAGVGASGEGGWKGLLRRFNPARLVVVFARGVSTKGFVALRVEGMGRYMIHREGYVWERKGLERLFRVKADASG